MQKLFVVATFCLALTAASPYDLVQDEQGQEYYLVPVSRVRRQTTTYDLENGVAKVKHEGTIFQTDNQRLDGTAYAMKDLTNKNKNEQFGGRLEYNHQNGHKLTANAEHMRQRGTKVGVEGSYNLYRNGPFHVDATGEWNRHYGGRGGTQHPNYNVGLTGTVDF